MQIKCEVGVTALGGAGVLSQSQSPFGSMAATLVVGGIWALQRVKTYGPQVMSLKAKEADFRRGAGFALHNFYRRIHG
jgi:hypothetical protein